jgi:hypothetical protein
MGDSLRKADVTKKLMQNILDELQKMYAPDPVIVFDKVSGIHNLVNDILENEDISEVLLEKISRVLGRRWMRRGDHR